MNVFFEAKNRGAFPLEKIILFGKILFVSSSKIGIRKYRGVPLSNFVFTNSSLLCGHQESTKYFASEVILKVSDHRPHWRTTQIASWDGGIRLNSSFFMFDSNFTCEFPKMEYWRNSEEHKLVGIELHTYSSTGKMKNAVLSGRKGRLVPY